MSTDEDFFNDFSKPAKRAPPPPPPNRPTAAAQRPSFNNTNRSTARATSARPSATIRRQPPAATTKASGTTSMRKKTVTRPTGNYYGTTGSATPSATPPATVPTMALAPGAQQTAAAAPSFYSQAPAPAVSATADDSGDWFTPDASSSAPSHHAPQQPLNTSTTVFQPRQPQQQTNPQQQFNNFQPSDLSGNMGTAARSQQQSVFVPQMAAADPTNGAMGTTYDFSHEPPILEELGINIPHIWLKTKAVALPSARLNKSAVLMDPQLIVEDADLAGPLALALILGGEMMLCGKLQFGYIYGFGMFGCVSMTLILNLMSPKAISVWTVTSILGYALLPVNILALIKIFLVNIIHLTTLARLLAVGTVCWSTVASTRLLEAGCQLRDQRYLVAYPIALLYSAFVLITIF